MFNVHYAYPQYLWAKEVYIILQKYNLLGRRTLIDAPCGNGVISYWLHKKFNINRIELIDNSEKQIGIAKKYLPSMDISCEDILKLGSNSNEDDIWLFINSLYCLNDGELIINHMKKRSEYIIGIFPHIDHMNYKIFFEKNPNFKNPTELNVSDTISLFNSSGYDLLCKKSITHFPFYKYNYRGSRIVFNLFDKLFSGRKGAYWISLFKRR